ncbi:YdbH domain-containing protein, partial [Sphingomonas bacterium]|uniref:YdbH domain-containing protein n=1 Tax=Sphingomonas bacterium TaxID=1895847 RepID=UPI00157730C6
GGWRLEHGALHLDGALKIADRAASPRFKPMASGDVALALVAGRVTGRASLQPLGRRERIADVVLRHDLASGVGDATLDVPGIAFRRGGLQPEMLTPLTLGVVANVTGVVTGRGRIDWTPRETRSGGDFHTDALDLAAAFGPVSGIATRIHFTDLLGLVSAPHQEARIAALNPGVIVGDGIAHYQLLPGNRVAVEDARWPFAGGTLMLEPGILDFSRPTDRRLTFTIAGLDAATFIQQLDFPNIAATGTFDGRLPMIFDATGGRIEGGALVARGPGTLAYVGELSNADIGTIGRLAFDALKAIRYSALTISLDGKLEGEIVSKVRFEGVRQATGERSIVARAIRNLPFRFNIAIRAPFRGLVGSARSYADPGLLLQGVQGLAARPPAVQPPATPLVR